MEEHRILLIEDDKDLTGLLKYHLTDQGYLLDTVSDGEAGLETYAKNEYSLVILDLMLPKLDGLEVCKMIRRDSKHTPILMLTAKSEELDKILGLELGADDYMTKPFSVRELIARIKAIFRRIRAEQEKANGSETHEEIRFGRLRIYPDKRKVVLSGAAIELTAKEFDLLALFARHPGRAYNRQELLDLVWGYQFNGYDHTVNSHINRLRSKIESDPANPVFIKTVWGVGYRFTEPEEIEQ